MGYGSSAVVSPEEHSDICHPVGSSFRAVPPSVYGFSAFLSEDFTAEEIYRREFANKIGCKVQAKKLSKPVQQFDKATGLLIKEYPSAHQAARETNLNPGHISECCSGKLKTTGGYIWKFKTNPPCDGDHTKELGSDV